MKKIIRLTESDLTRIVKRVISEQMDSGEDLQNRLAILYLMRTKKLDKVSAEKELRNQSGYDNFITYFDGQNEAFMDWLQSVGLKRTDVYINDSNRDRVKMFLSKNKM